MVDFSDDDVGVQNACEHVDKVEVDESELVKFFEACCALNPILLCFLSNEWRP